MGDWPGANTSGEMLTDEIRRGKGGVIGLGGKAAIAIRIDHGMDDFGANIFDLLTERSLPAGIGVFSEFDADGAYEGNTVTTWSDIVDWNEQGIEVWAHGATHADGADLVAEVVDSKATIEAQGIKVMGWQTPGSPATYGTGLTSPLKFAEELAGPLILANYGISEASLTGTNRRVLPTRWPHGLDHVTIDTLSLANVQSHIDHAVRRKFGIELMLHPNYIGEGGYMSLADFESVLDYIVTEREAGNLVVLTPSGLAFADPSSDWRANLVSDGDFEGLSTADKGEWTENSANSWEIRTDGGHTGDNYLRVSATGTRAINATAQIVNLGYDGFTFEAGGWVRSNDTGGTTWRIRVRQDGVLLFDKFVAISQSATWQHVSVPFTITPGTGTLAVEFGRAGGGYVDWDDVYCRPV